MDRQHSSLTEDYIFNTPPASPSNRSKGTNITGVDSASALDSLARSPVSRLSSSASRRADDPFDIQLEDEEATALQSLKRSAVTHAENPRPAAAEKPPIEAMPPPPLIQLKLPTNLGRKQEEEPTQALSQLASSITSPTAAGEKLVLEEEEEEAGLSGVGVLTEQQTPKDGAYFVEEEQQPLSHDTTVTASTRSDSKSEAAAPAEALASREEPAATPRPVVPTLSLKPPSPPAPLSVPPASEEPAAIAETARSSVAPAASTSDATPATAGRRYSSGVTLTALETGPLPEPPPQLRQAPQPPLRRSEDEDGGKAGEETRPRPSQKRVIRRDPNDPMVYDRLYALRRTEPAVDTITLGRDHTFKPKLLTDGFFRVNNFVVGQGPFSERLYDMERWSLYWKRMADKKKSLEVQGCTFAPQILRTASAARGADDKSIFQRLYEKHPVIEQKKVDGKKLKEEAELLQCTFTPTLIRSSSPERRAQDAARDKSLCYGRLYGEAMDRFKRIDSRLKQRLPDCTFAPNRETKKAGEAGYRSQGRERATELYQLGHQQVTQLRLVEEAKKPPKVDNSDETQCTFFPVTNWATRKRRPSSTLKKPPVLGDATRW